MYCVAGSGVSRWVVSVRCINWGVRGFHGGGDGQADAGSGAWMAGDLVLLLWPGHVGILLHQAGLTSSVHVTGLPHASRPQQPKQSNRLRALSGGLEQHMAASPAGRPRTVSVTRASQLRPWYPRTSCCIPRPTLPTSQTRESLCSLRPGFPRVWTRASLVTRAFTTLRELLQSTAQLHHSLPACTRMFMAYWSLVKSKP